MPLGVGGAVPSVLLVEDDAPTRVFLSENLIADRFAPVSATSAEEAVTLLLSPGWSGRGESCGAAPIARGSSLRHRCD